MLMMPRNSDQPRDDEDCGDKLEYRPGDVRDEVALKPQLVDVVLFELAHDFRQVAGFLSDGGQRTEQRGEHVPLFFQRLVQRPPGLEFRREQTGGPPNRGHPLARQQGDRIGHHHAAGQRVPERATQIDQVGRAQLPRQQIHSFGLRFSRAKRLGRKQITKNAECLRVDFECQSRGETRFSYLSSERFDSRCSGRSLTAPGIRLGGRGRPPRSWSARVRP